MIEEINPVVGMGVSERVGSDSYAYTIVEIISPKRIVVQGDTVTRIDDNGPFTESQDYHYEPNPNGYKVLITKRKNGYWYRKGYSMKSASPFGIGYRRSYRDPCF